MFVCKLKTTLTLVLIDKRVVSILLIDIDLNVYTTLPLISSAEKDHTFLLLLVFIIFIVCITIRFMA